MKKITSIAALLIALVMLASCTVPSTPQTKPEDEVKTTLSEFMSAVLSFDLEKAETYTDNSGATDELTDKLNIDKITSTMEDSAGSFLPSDKVTEFISSFAKKILSSVKYEVKDVKVDGDKADATVAITYPDFDSIDTSSADVDIEGLMTEAFGFNLTDVTTFMAKYAEKKGVSADELVTLFSSGDQEALMNDMFVTFEPEFKKMFDLMGDKIVELTANKAKTDESTVKLKKDSNNNWKISDMD